MDSPVRIVASERMQEMRREADQVRMLKATGLERRRSGSVWQALLCRIRGLIAAVQFRRPAAQRLEFVRARADDPCGAGH